MEIIGFFALVVILGAITFFVIANAVTVQAFVGLNWKDVLILLIVSSLVLYGWYQLLFVFSPFTIGVK